MEEEKKETKVDPNRVKAAQMEMGKNSQEMADLLGVKPAVYYNKLFGSNSWTLKDIARLVEESGHSFDYFFGRAVH